jgi:hypothetical protein
MVVGPTRAGVNRVSGAMSYLAREVGVAVVGD